MAGNEGFNELTRHPGDEEDSSPERELFASAQEMEEATSRLASWLDAEIRRALSARWMQERVWNAAMQMYEGTPQQERRNFPIENAPNLEVTLGAIAVDAIYAQIVNLIFNVSPIITVSPVSESGQWTEHAKALQRFVEVIVRNQLNLRNAVENAVLDTVKLGTGILYSRWSERRKKTSVEEVLESGPVLQGIPVEDFLVPGGSYGNLQNDQWVAVRYYLTEHELHLRERDFGWDIEGAIPTAGLDTVRTTRERLGRTDSFTRRKAGDDNAGSGKTYEIFDVWCLYDIDGDGLDEDLLATWDMGSKCILKWRFNPYDRRPFEAMRYQLRQYMFYGMGIIEMLEPFQRGATELYNHWVLNSLLANTRFWVGKHGAVPKNQLRIWPNRYLPLQDPKNDLQAIQMAEVYPSAPAALATTVSFAERRSGINDLTAPRPSQVLGSRTPGITAISLLQKANERFGPAFDSARITTAAAVRQALFRYQERLLAGDVAVETTILEMMGEERGALVIELLRNRKFDNAVAVELTASTVQSNRETARQNMLLLLQAVLPYFERLIQLQAIIDNPSVSPGMKDIAQRVAEAAGEAVERVVRTFDEVRDPKALVVKLSDATDQAMQGQLAQLGQLMQLLGRMDQIEQGGGLGGGFITPPVG
jgi:hypothetical protein